MGRALLPLLFLSFVCGAASAQGDYEIRLFRPNKPGDQYHLSATGRQIRQVVLRSAAGEALRSQRDTFTVDLTGSVLVVNTDPKGNVTRAQVTIDSLVRAVGLQRDELLKPETVVIEERTGARQQFLIDGKPVGPELNDALDVALSETNDPGAPSDDELMGTPARQKVGGKWPVNRERMARFFSEDSNLSITVRPEDVTGGGQLAALSRAGGVEAMRVDVTMTILGQPRGPVREGLQKARIDLKLSTLLPVDPALDTLEESTQLTMTLTAPAGTPQEGKAPDQLVTVWEQRSDRKLQPIAK